MKTTMVLLTAAWLAANAAGEQTITHTGAWREHEAAGWIVQGQFELPSAGLWSIAPDQAPEAPREIYVRPPDDVLHALTGTRMAQVQVERNLRQGQTTVRQLYWPCVEYARKHDGAGPATISELDAVAHSGFAERMNRSPWPEHRPALEGPFVFLIPQVPFRFEGEDRRRIVPGQRQPLAFELRPFEDDGMHWVLFTDGRASRETIDPATMARYGQTVRPVSKRSEKKEAADHAVYAFMALVGADTPPRFSVRVRNALAGDTRVLDWTWSKTPVDEALAAEWTQARLAAWQAHAQTEPTSATGHWFGLLGAGDRLALGRDGTRFASVFSLFGGRPAIAETLQTRLLSDNAVAPGPRTIDIATVEGVEVKSHPYAAMLGDRVVAAPDLMRLAPQDRLAVYVSRPSAIPGMLDGGAAFFAELGEGFSGGGARYDATERTLRLLGMRRDWLDALLASGAVRDAVLIADDMFFVDGTDVVVVARLNRSPALDGLLKMVGLADPKKDGLIPVPTVEGRHAYWILREDWLAAGTSRQGVERVLRTQAHPDESLARSAEFRYMLSKVPLQERTRALVYFSDPFIRRLVGPETKIGQLRRAVAKGTMEHVMAAALLARLNGWPAPITLAQLQERGLLSKQADVSTIALRPDGSASCSIYGSPAWPVGLGSVPVAKVSEEEADAYRDYLREYNRFWREFFDPIAIRLDDRPEGGLEATTFILPLLDNSLYNGLREALSKQTAQPLRVPQLVPAPVLTLSLNLPEVAWKGIVEGLTDLFAMGSPIAPAALDDLGPALHLALFDADPVIALGSGDIFGAFGGNIAGMRNAEMLAIPIALSVLTRPCALVIETRDPARTLQFLNSAAGASPPSRRRRMDDIRYEFYRTGDRDEWVYALDVAGLLKLRFGIAVMGEHVVVRNIPWSRTDAIAGLTDSPLPTARLAVTPGAGRLQLPGLHSSAMEKKRATAMRGLARLYPLMLALNLSADEAADRHFDWFGFRPAHPDGGAWTGDARRLESAMFGRPDRPRQPAHAEGDTSFGIMQAIESMNVSMQFEDDGLRTVLQWKTR